MDIEVKKAQQRLFNLRRQNILGICPRALTVSYRSTIGSIRSGCIMAGYGNSTATDCKVLQRVVRSAEHTIGCLLTAIQETYNTRCCRKAKKIIKDLRQASHSLFSLLPLLRRGQYRSIMTKTVGPTNSFYPQTIRLLNSHHSSATCSPCPPPASWTIHPSIHPSLYMSIQICLSHTHV